MYDPIWLISVCWECTLEVVPMLLGTWLLGWLFWWIFNTDNNQKTKGNLEEQIGELKTRTQQLEAELAHFNFDKTAAQTEIRNLQHNYQELHNRHEALVAEKGKTAHVIHHPVPPPQTLVDQMEEEDKKGQSLIYLSDSPAEGGESSPKVPATTRKTALRLSKKALQYSNFFKPTDLSIFAGIDPKVEKLLNDHDITTWTRLTVTPAHKLKAMLANAGANFETYDSSTWSLQASLARVGRWKELIKLQKIIHPARKSKVRQRFRQGKLNDLHRVDDLKVIEGIGPKTEQLLKDGGIDNWAKLAGATQEDLQQILTTAGPHFRLINPASWPQQAAFAAANDWDGLKTFQEKLRGGSFNE